MACFVEDTQVQKLTELIAGAGQIFFAAAGRSLLVVKCCAMRLMQIGLTVHVVGEVTTPAIRPGDLLIVTSGSGETATVVQMAKKAKKLGASLGVITIVPDSSLGCLADVTVTIRAKSTKVDGSRGSTRQLGANLFEQSVLIFLDCLVSQVAERLGIPDPDRLLMENHANLE